MEPELRVEALERYAENANESHLLEIILLRALEQADATFGRKSAVSKVLLTDLQAYYERNGNRTKAQIILERMAECVD